MPLTLDHVCLNVRDMDAAIAFYQDHFSMKLLSRKEIPENNAEIAFLGYREDGMKLELTHWADWAEDDYEEGSMFDHIAVTCPDVPALHQELLEAGVEEAMEPFQLSTGSHISFVKDLDGNWIELVQRR